LPTIQVKEMKVLKIGPSFDVVHCAQPHSPITHVPHLLGHRTWEEQMFFILFVCII